MIIDIDIKIADSEGKLVKRFTKRFDEKAETAEKVKNKEGLSKDFEDFLSEYLSASGRQVRERLITYPGMETSFNDKRNTTKAQGLHREEEKEYGLMDSEMEYKIRIGNHKVIAGKIPFHRLSRLHSLADALEKAENENLTLSGEEGSGESYPVYNPGPGNGIFHGGSGPEHNLNSKSKELQGELEKNIKNLMIQAVEKYESSFYHTGEEEEISRQEIPESKYS